MASPYNKPVYQQQDTSYSSAQTQPFIHPQQTQHYPDQQHQVSGMQYQQPQSQAPMSQHQSGSRDAGGEREWENGMCGCCSPFSTCCLGFWCPCIVYSRIQHRIRNKRMEEFSACNGPCMAWTCVSFTGFQWVMSMIQRGDIRAKYHLHGSGCGDCMRHCCCSCCTLIQEDKETKLLDLQEKTNTIGYAQQNNMAYP